MKLIQQRLLPLFFCALCTLILLLACSKSLEFKVSTWHQLTENCRIVQHEMGETCIPNNPQHLITISRFTLANALVLGVKPIGSTSDYEFSAYLKNKIEGIESVGGMRNPSLEKILLLKPDLILGFDLSNDIYPFLSQISPTVLGGSIGSWREHFNFVAEVLGKKEAAQQAWNRYYQRIEELKTALKNRYEGKKISVIQNTGDIRSFPKNSFSGSILNELGLERPNAQNINTPLGYASEPISQEKLEEVDGDIVFVMIFHKEGKADMNPFNELQQSPLWRSLKAAKANQVYLVDRDPWIGANLIAADVVIDDLYRYLVKTP